MRTCIVSGQTLPQTQLLRFVVGPDNVIVPDVLARAPGRGLWIEARRDVLETAVKKKAFARAARQPVTAGPALLISAEQALLRTAQHTLGLARKAGVLVSGFDMVMAALKKHVPGCLIEASDGAADGQRKIMALARHIKDDLVVIKSLTSTELGAAIGRDGAHHMVMYEGALAARFIEIGTRLSRYRLLFHDEREDIRS